MRLITMMSALAMLLPVAVKADECPFRDGGYCVAVLTATTSGIIANWIPIDKKEISSSVASNLNHYESLWDDMIKAKRATEQEREKVFLEAKKAGGNKIGGINLVVLAAGTLQHLVDKDVVTQEEAQRILDEAKK